MKTKEELNAIKNEVEALSSKLAELSEEELEQVTGGINIDHFKGKFKYVLNGAAGAKLAGSNPPSGTFEIPDNDTIYERHIYTIDK